MIYLTTVPGMVAAACPFRRGVGWRIATASKSDWRVCKYDNLKGAESDFEPMDEKTVSDG
jgi:alpha-glucuronidase